MKSQARVHIGDFVKGKKVDDLNFMKQVENRRGGPRFGSGVWSVRPLGDPQHRFFGVFALPDWFLIYCKQTRAKLAKHENRWHEELDKVLKTHSDLFPGFKVYTGTEFSHYVTRNWEHNDDRWYPI